MEQKESILIIDDDESTCKSLSLILNKKGYDTGTASMGKEALQKVRERFFNLALLDLKLPDTEGVELVTPLQRIHPDMVILIITGHASLESAVRTSLEGALAYITKPLNIDSLLTAVRDALERQRRAIGIRQLSREAKGELARGGVRRNEREHSDR
jgi:DNA-binding NtrC family response regulator